MILAFLIMSRSSLFSCFKSSKIRLYKAAQGCKEFLTFILEELVQADRVALLFLKRGHNKRKRKQGKTKGQG